MYLRDQRPARARVTISRTVEQSALAARPGAPLTPAMMLALQRTAGNAATTASVQRTAGHAATVQRARIARPRKASKAGVRKVIKASQYKSRKFGAAGAWTPLIKRSTARSFKAAPDEQALRHLSIQLFHYLREHVDAKSDEQEIQAAWVGDGLVVASNDDASVTKLYDDLSARVTTWLAARDPDTNPVRQVMGTDHTTNDLRAGTIARKQQRFFHETDPRPVRPGAEKLLYDIQAGQLTEATLARPSGSLDTGRLAGRITFLTGSAEHAEQKIVLALKRAGWTGDALITGKKRPCTVCWLTLMYARERAGLSKLRFQGNPGGLWQTAVNGFVQLVQLQGDSAEAAELWTRHKLAGAQSHVTMAISAKLGRGRAVDAPAADQKGTTSGYGSDSDSDASDSSDVEMED